MHLCRRRSCKRRLRLYRTVLDLRRFVRILVRVPGPSHFSRFERQNSGKVWNVESGEDLPRLAAEQRHDPHAPQRRVAML
jgi:hypothetical protein